MSTLLPAAKKGGCRRFYDAATNIKHACGMLLSMKRYIGRNSVVEWALFRLQMQIHSRRDLLFNISSFSKNNMKKDFEKLKSLLSVHPRQRSPEVLRQIQFCLKKNRAFQSLHDKIQLELCQHFIYQEYESNTLVIKQGHVPCECYIVLSGQLEATIEESSSKKRSSSSSTLYEVDEGDFFGDIVPVNKVKVISELIELRLPKVSFCISPKLNDKQEVNEVHRSVEDIGLTTNERLTSFVCKSDVELLVIDKEAFKEILAAKVQEEYYALCDFLRGLFLFSSWPSKKLEFLVHCSLQRSYRTGTTVVVDSTKSSSLVLVKSGKCLIVVHLTQDRPSSSYSTTNYNLVLNRLPTVPFLLEKRQCSPDPLERSILPRTAFSASFRTPSVEMRTRNRPQTAGPATFSLRDRSIHCDLDQTEKRLGDKGRRGQQDVSTLSSVRFVTIGTLERGGIFGLAETMFRSSNLRFSLISEGADCIFIPTKLFLAEAPAKSRQIAQELVNSFPRETKIRECYASLQTWRAYKEKCIRRPVSGGMKSPNLWK
ncbi:cyclic nucleotide-binding domain-containing protein 2-like [Eleutherodactylus coqui]|uniref:cyclic nucleotide-binding domain-containing protein 2-like n=1 Tax=Eleutherodactylus coqui TaxID=57060 RepID=UPI003461F990